MKGTSIRASSEVAVRTHGYPPGPVAGAKRSYRTGQDGWGYWGMICPPNGDKHLTCLPEGWTRACSRSQHKFALCGVQGRRQTVSEGTERSNFCSGPGLHGSSPGPGSHPGAVRTWTSFSSMPVSPSSKCHMKT